MSCIHVQKTKIYSVFFLIYFSIASNKVNKRVVFYDCKYTNWRYKKIVQDKIKTIDKVPLLFDKEKLHQIVQNMARPFSCSYLKVLKRFKDDNMLYYYL